jgi:hypothetical protein
LSQLLDRKSFIILYTLSHNRHRVKTTALADSGANAFVLLDTKCIRKISEFLNNLLKTLERPVLVKGYNGQIDKSIISILQIYLQVNRQQQYNVSFLVIDLEHYDVILGYK